MDLFRFIFIASMKALGLLFLGLLATKAVEGLRPHESHDRRRTPFQWGLAGVILALVALGAITIGYDVAAEFYARAGERGLAERDLARAYTHARQAVEFRPGNLRYWQVLSTVKFTQKHYASVIADGPALQALGGGNLSEPDAYRLSVVHYLVGEYDQVHPLTRRLIRDNRFYAAPHVLEGYTLLAESKHDEATKVFLEVLRMFPEHQSAVEGLAHAQYLGGNPGAAISVLNQTAKYKFPPEVRNRFEALKGLYGLE